MTDVNFYQQLIIRGKSYFRLDGVIHFLGVVVLLFFVVAFSFSYLKESHLNYITKMVNSKMIVFISTNFTKTLPTSAVKVELFRYKNVANQFRCYR